ncbi:hypothetical protein ACVME5_001077 [Bradyrhizobium liaoningense]
MPETTNRHGPHFHQETLMGNAMVNALIAAGVVFAIGYG